MSEDDLDKIESCRALWFLWLSGVTREGNDAAAIEGLNKACERLIEEVRRLHMEETIR